jgi:hypothetical protein
MFARSDLWAFSTRYRVKPLVPGRSAMAGGCYRGAPRPGGSHAAEGVERLATISTITRYLPRAPSRDAPDRHRCGRGTNTDAVLSEDGQIRARGQTPTTADVTAGIMTALAELAGDPEGRPWRDPAVLRSARRLCQPGPFRAAIFSPLDPCCEERGAGCGFPREANSGRGGGACAPSHPLPYAGFVIDGPGGGSVIEP